MLVALKHLLVGDATKNVGSGLRDNTGNTKAANRKPQIADHDRHCWSTDHGCQTAGDMASKSPSPDWPFLDSEGRADSFLASDATEVTK